MQQSHHQSQCTYSNKLSAMLRRKIEKKIEDILGEDQFGFRKGKGRRDVVGMLRIMSE